MCLRGFVLKNWKELAHLFPSAVHEDIDLFIRDIQYYCSAKSEEADSFLGRLGELDIGVIRTFSVGWCESSQLDSALREIFSGLIPPVVWRESFAESTS
jgi:hypothetical protein